MAGMRVWMLPDPGAGPMSPADMQLVAVGISDIGFLVSPVTGGLVCLVDAGQAVRRRGTALQPAARLVLSPVLSAVMGRETPILAAAKTVPAVQIGRYVVQISTQRRSSVVHAAVPLLDGAVLGGLVCLVDAGQAVRRRGTSLLPAARPARTRGPYAAGRMGPILIRVGSRRS